MSSKGNFWTHQVNNDETTCKEYKYSLNSNMNVTKMQMHFNDLIQKEVHIETFYDMFSLIHYCPYSPLKNNALE